MQISRKDGLLNMKTNLKTIGIATVLMLSTLLMGCGSKEALGKKELERLAKNYAKGPIKIGKFIETEENDYPVNILKAKDKEYRFEFEVKSEVRTVGGFDGTVFFNPFTDEPMVHRQESSTFHEQYLATFGKLYEDELDDIENEYDVEIQIYTSGGYKPSNYIMAVRNCEDEDQCEDIFDDIVDLLKEYDTRNYFEQSEKDYSDIEYGIIFYSETTIKDGHSSEERITDINLEPSKW